LKQYVEVISHFCQARLDVPGTLSRVPRDYHQGDRKEKIFDKEIQSGSRRGKTPKNRSDLAYQLVTEYGVTLAETGRQLGVSTSAISKILERRGKSLSI